MPPRHPHAGVKKRGHLLGRLIPKDQQFFEMFSDLARRVTAAARLLDKLMAEPQNLQQRL